MTPDEQAQQQQLEVAKETLKKLGFVTREEQQKIMQEEKAVTNQPHFLWDGYFNLICARPMPTYSVPGLIDHF